MGDQLEKIFACHKSPVGVTVRKMSELKFRPVWLLGHPCLSQIRKWIGFGDHADSTHHVQVELKCPCTLAIHSEIASIQAIL